MKKKKNNNAKIERVYEKPLKVFGKPVRVKRLMLIALVGMLLGVMGYLEIKALAWLIFGILNAGLFIFVFVLQEKSILYFGEKSLEVSPSGDLYITKLEGTCPTCSGKLKIAKKSSKTYIICEKNENHVWDSK